MLYIIALIIFLGLFLISLFCLFFKKTRAIAGRSAIGSLLCMVGVLLKVYYPLTFERHYLKHPDTVNSEQTLAMHVRQSPIYLGAAVRSMSQLSDTKYMNLFTSITPENDLKLGGVLIDLDKLLYDFSAADQMVDAALAKGLRVRGHALVFGKASDMFKSPDLDAWLEKYTQEERRGVLLNLMTTHIETVLTHYKGRIHEWDVVNEVLGLFSNGEYEENVFYRHIGEDYIRIALETARRVDPDVKLYLNEQLRNYNNQRAEAFYHLIAKLIEQGVPLDGVGLQAHNLYELAPPTTLKTYMERLSRLGVSIEITELEARLRLFKDAPDPYSAQGEYYRDVASQCLLVEECKGVTFWGFADNISWMDELPFLFPQPNEPYLLDAKGNKKPAVSLLTRTFSEFNHNKKGSRDE